MSDSSSSQSQQSTPGSSFGRVFQSKISFILWLTRFSTIIFTLLHLLSFEVNNHFQRALISSAATSALRLHQRVPTIQLNTQFLQQLFQEDSAHYLLYSLLFATTSSSLSLALLPICLFASLHWSTTTLQLLSTNSRLYQWLSLLVQQYQRSILQCVALTEIMLFPTLIICLFSGIVSLLTPFVYFRFLSLRYFSRRNPYSRQMMFELKVNFQQLLSHERCPLIIQRIGNSLIQFISRLA